MPWKPVAVVWCNDVDVGYIGDSAWGDVWLTMRKALPSTYIDPYESQRLTFRLVDSDGEDRPTKSCSAELAWDGISTTFALLVVIGVQWNTRY